MSATMLFAALEKIISPDIGDLIAYIKINDGVHNPDMGGPVMVKKIRNFLENWGYKDAGIFLDLKIYDVSTTMVNILKKYIDCPPNILTISAACSVEGIRKVRELLPQTKLALVSALTDMSADECLCRFGMIPEVKIYNDLTNIRHAYQADGEPFDLVVCSAHELGFLKRNLPKSYGYIVPGIRDAWMVKADEHQKRIIGAKKALEMGATYLVMGTQVTTGNPSLNITPAISRQLTRREIRKAKLPLEGQDPLEVLKDSGGYYKCPVDDTDKPMGPLVAYAGSYPVEMAGKTELKNFVGLEYFNFAKAEEKPDVRSFFASLIADKIKEAGLLPAVVIGAPMGGILLAGSLSEIIGCTSIFAEKKVTALANPTEGAKEKSDLIIDRHDLNEGHQAILIEDVCNNFSTTAQIKALIESKGATLIAIACAFNRSGKADFEGIPVISAREIPTKQYRQDDPEVSGLINEGKVVWKPKQQWAALAEAMNK